MDLIGYITVLRRRWLSILSVMLVTLALTAGFNLIQTPTYTATTRLFFAVQAGESATDLAQGSSFTEKQMTSYAEVARSPLVLDRVIKQLSLPTSARDLSNLVTATAQADTVILAITVRNVDPSASAQIANSIAEQVTAVTASLSPSRPDGSQATKATILAAAVTPITPSSPLVVRNLALALILGLLLGCALAVLRHTLDTRIRNEHDVADATEHAILGLVPFDPATPAHPIVMHDDALSGRSEAVRRLRTNLQFVEAADGAKSILITSSVSGEGKTTTALNLAVSLSDAGHRVILIDADLRRPAIAQYLGMEASVGLTTVLIGKAEVADVVQPWRDTGLDVLAAGQTPPNPSELLGSPPMLRLLEELSETYDKIVVDSPPLLPVTDATVLSKIVGGTLVVVGADHLHRAQLRKAVESLETVGANLMGIVINKISRRDAGAYGYGYGYAYGYDGKNPPSGDGDALGPVDGPDGPAGPSTGVEVVEPLPGHQDEVAAVGSRSS